ncbi:hypothetical protein AB0N81_38085 [Streptomyces sp. NPDC093510]|uniref:hypothetical protein n=1 Tax=Streptomyces sp. NPDC093510 TaxID=3155199 RepID=UPI003441883E
MSRGTRLAAMAGLACAGAGVIIAVAAASASEPEPRPTPPRVYSSCLAADTKPISADDDPCDGR